MSTTHPQLTALAATIAMAIPAAGAQAASAQPQRQTRQFAPAAAGQLHRPQHSGRRQWAQPFGVRNRTRTTLMISAHRAHRVARSRRRANPGGGAK